MVGTTDRSTPFLDDIDKTLEGLNLSTFHVDKSVLKEIQLEHGRRDTRKCKEKSLSIRVSGVTYDMLDALIDRLGTVGRREVVEVAIRSLMRSVLRIEKADKSKQRGEPAPAETPDGGPRWQIPQ